MAADPTPVVIRLKDDCWVRQMGWNWQPGNLRQATVYPTPAAAWEAARRLGIVNQVEKLEDA